MLSRRWKGCKLEIENMLKTHKHKQSRVFWQIFAALQFMFSVFGDLKEADISPEHSAALWGAFRDNLNGIGKTSTPTHFSSFTTSAEAENRQSVDRR